MQYEYNYSLASGVVLGGIGTGSVEIRADGCLHEWHIFNNGSWSSRSDCRKLKVLDREDFFFAIRVSYGERILVRLLRADNYTLGACPYRMPWLKPVDKIIFKGEPPIAMLEYFDEDLNKMVSISLEAFTPLIPGDLENSIIPVAIFKFNIRNLCESNVDISMLAGIRNPFTKIGNYIALSTCHTVKGISYVKMHGSDIPETHPMYGGELALAIVNGKASAYMGDDINSLRRAWARFRGSGEIDIVEKYASSKPYYTAVFRGIKVNPISSTEILILLAWFFPNHIDEDNVKLGHYYENRFSGVKDILEYVYSKIDYLYNKTRVFHDTLYGVEGLERWIADLIGAQISVIQKSTWLTKNGRFGIWEGYYDPYYRGPMKAAFNTTDVMFYGSNMILLLYPTLERKFIRQQVEWFLDETKEPYYTLYALTIPENLAEFKKAITKDPTILTSFNNIRKVVREIIRKTGKDPKGRIMHAFCHSIAKPDSYHMLDTIPKIILLLYRDLIWLGEVETLKKTWSNIKQAIKHVLSLDPTGLKLPYHYMPAGFEHVRKIMSEIEYYEPIAHEMLHSILGQAITPIGYQTFDDWSMIGVTAYTSILWLAAILATSKVSESIVKDLEYSRHLNEIYENARRKIIELLWNGKYFNLWFDPISKKKDNCCMAAQLAGQWFSTLLTDLGYVVERDKVIKTLTSIVKYNLQEDEGLINGVYPNKPRPAFKGDLEYHGDLKLPYLVSSQTDTPWSGIEFMVASHLICEGMLKEAKKILKEVYKRYKKAGHFWNHIEWGMYYMRPMVAWTIILAVEGLKYNALKKMLEIKPKLNRLKWIFIIPGTWGRLEYETDNKIVRLEIDVKHGSFTIRELKIKCPKKPEKLDLYIDDAKPEIKSPQFKDNTLTITLGRVFNVSKNLLLEISF